MTHIGLWTAALVAATGATSSFAQTGPTSAPERPNVTSPYWNPSGDAPRGGMSSASQIQTNDEPSRLVAQTVTAVPQARAEAVASRWIYRQAEHDLNLATDNLSSDFRQSEEFVSANNELQAAYADYTNVREAALRSVRETDEYQAAQSLRSKLSSQIKDVAAATPEGQKPDLDRLHAMASLKIDYITPIRQVERDVLASSPAVAQARTRLQNAAREVARLERNFAREARDSVELADLRKAREQAKITSLAAAAYLVEARWARNIALDYAYYSRGIDRYIPRYTDGYGYGYGGLGYGYGGLNTGVFGTGLFGTRVGFVD